jgi:hypothetical protein
MNRLEQQLLHQECGPTEPRLCLRTGTHVDTGRWWRKSPLWLCLMTGELILLAVGRRRYFERITIAECHSIRYHHASGELVIEPGEDLRFNRLSLSPRDAIHLLKLLETEKPSTTIPELIKC